MSFGSIIAQMTKACMYVFSIDTLGLGDWGGSFDHGLLDSPVPSTPETVHSNCAAVPET